MAPVMDGNIRKIRTPHDIRVLTLLLNQICNFSCAYCYSSKGRSKEEMSLETIKAVLDFYVVRERGEYLQIVFSGGGDPLLSFDKFKGAVDYAKLLASKNDVRLDVGVVTNGSLLKDDIIGYLKENDIGLVVSFDILKDVHNAQRSHYDVVAGTIDKLLNSGMSIGIRSTITPLNVSRQKEMVEELHSKFPAASCVAFEAVINDRMFKDVSELRAFYNAFVESFFQARERGAQLGIEVGNTEYMNAFIRQERSCLGKFVVTPEGKLTSCSRISSPLEDHYDSFVYGEVKGGKLLIDDERYREIMNEATVYNKECTECSARWNCGGGCLLARKAYSHEYFREHCRFIRKITAEALNSNKDELV